MDNQKTIIALLCVIIAILIVGILFSPLMAKKDSNLAISNKKLNAGDSFSVKLTDGKGNPIANQTVNIKLTDKEGTTIDEDLTTNSKGTVKFKIDEQGKYSVECRFDGNDQFASTSTAGNITVKKPTTTVTSEEQTSSTTQTSYLYDINNLPPSNDPYPETTRYYIDEYHVKQEYEDGYMRTVDIRTGEIHSLGFK